MPKDARPTSPPPEARASAPRPTHCARRSCRSTPGCERDPASRLERDAISALLQQPAVLGRELAVRGATAYIANPSLAVVRDGQAVDHGGPKQAALLAGLALHLGHVVPADALVDLVWGDRPPPSASGRSNFL